MIWNKERETRTVNVDGHDTIEAVHDTGEWDSPGIPD